jgi:DNA-binding transcriptional ArsR family regulator
VKDEVKLLKALGDETRMKIVQCLLDGEQCACTIVPYAGKSQPNISQHLKILEEADVLESRRDGVRIIYRIKDERTREIMTILGIQKIKVEAKC